MSYGPDCPNCLWPGPNSLFLDQFEFERISNIRPSSIGYSEFVLKYWDLSINYLLSFGTHDHFVTAIGPSSKTLRMTLATIC